MEIESQKRELKMPQLKITSLEKQKIQFTLDNCQSHIASALRRIMLAEIPTMAPHIVNMIENTSPLPDEYVAHRIGMIPFVSSNVDSYKYGWECQCSGDDDCTQCREMFEINVFNTDDQIITVTSLDIRKMNQSIRDGEKVEPVKVFSELDPNKELGIPIVKLNKNQKFQCTFRVEKGYGKMHSKWSPVSVAAMAYEPIITLQPEIQDMNVDKKRGLVASCPKKVFGYNEKNQNLEIVDKDACMYCDECTKYMAQEVIKGKDGVSNFMTTDPSVQEIESYVSVKQQKDRYLFSVETTGALKPAEVVRNGMLVLKQKLYKFRDHMNKTTEILQKGISNL